MEIENKAKVLAIQEAFLLNEKDYKIAPSDYDSFLNQRSNGGIDIWCIQTLTSPKSEIFKECIDYQDMQSKLCELKDRFQSKLQNKVYDL